jgi:hypothetical protein
MAVHLALLWEATMTMKIADVAPHESQLIDLSERLSEVLSTSRPRNRTVQNLDFDPSYLEAARGILMSLSEQAAAPVSEEIPLTQQQLETYLDCSPEFQSHPARLSSTGPKLVRAKPEKKIEKSARGRGSDSPCVPYSFREPSKPRDGNC